MTKNGQRIAEGVVDFLLRPATRWAICWLIALGAACFLAKQAWTTFNVPQRRDGNGGHAWIDFGGTWLMGRMIVEGHGRQLYYRNYIRPIAEEHYPAEDDDPRLSLSDAEHLLFWMLKDSSERKSPRVVASCLGPFAATNAWEETALLACGKEKWTAKSLAKVTAPHLGGQPYPPIHALLFAPLTLLSPRPAYRVMQALILLLVFFNGWLAQRITQGQVWWPVAVAILSVFPGMACCIVFGQNSMFSLTAVMLGWYQLMRGREAWAGLCWGLLAFKPVWAVAFLLVPLLTRHWRMAASMILTGLAQIVVTLPVVGWQTWLDWLYVGRLRTHKGLYLEFWIYSSRDVQNIPRRLLSHFAYGIAVKDGRQFWATILGWSMWAAVLLVTSFLVWRQRQCGKERRGPAAAFVLLGAIFTCYQFMYYDILLAALPVLLVFAELRCYLPSVSWHWPSCDSDKTKARKSSLKKVFSSVFGVLRPPFKFRLERSSVPPLLLLLMVMLSPLPYYLVPLHTTLHIQPWDLYSLLLLWMWCGYRVLREQPAAGISRPAI